MLKLVDSVDNLVLGILQFLLSDHIEFLGLFEIELKLFTFTISLALLVFLPVFNTLLVPLLHEASIALQLVDLDSAHLLLPHGGDLLILGITACGEVRLGLLLFIKLLQVRFHIELLLRLVERVDACFEELVLDTVVFFFGIGDFLSGLVVAELTSLGEHCDVCCRVDLFQAHLELVEQSESKATLPLHDLVDHLGVELDIEVAQ